MGDVLDFRAYCQRQLDEYAEQQLSLVSMGLTREPMEPEDRERFGHLWELLEGRRQ